MDTTRFDELLARALEVSADEQSAFMEANCEDPDLRQELIALLAKESELSEFLETPAGVILDNSEQERPSKSRRPNPTKTRELPKTIGPFRIRELLGEGGMGVVYLAEQDEPVERELAVKVVRADLTSPGACERFAAERQALARLSHPHIAQMYEAGTTEDGFPYFAMELVTGLPITKYCDRNLTSIERRLELFVQVCEGVQHAHQRGIIHRDIKPSNILVTERDGVPTPKIIDFGIAKALDRPLTDVTQLTGLGAVGTPAYMSPESLGIGEESSDVDTRSDVYALGILLYELLSGTRPFETKGASFATIVLRITKEDAEQPSARLRAEQPDAQASAARSRGTSTEALHRHLKGDLDWIVMKAIARRREDRYHSPAELVADIQRYLSNRPVSATPPSILYSAGRFLRRHRGPVLAAALLLLALIGGLVARTLEAQRANREAKRANLEAERALAVLDEAQELSGFLAELFEGADPESRGEKVSARQLVDRAAERLRSDSSFSPLPRARFMVTLGEIYTKLGVLEEAEELLSRSLELRRTHDPEDQLALAESLNQLAVLHRNQGDFLKAEPLVLEALEIRRNHPQTEPQDLADTLNNLGNLRWDQGRHEEAEPLYEEVLRLRNQLGDLEGMASVQVNLGALKIRQNRWGEAKPLLESAMTTFENTLGPDHPNIGMVCLNLATAYWKLGSWENAQGLRRRSVEVFSKSYGPEHFRTLYARRGLARDYRDLGDYSKALEEFEALEALGEKNGRYLRVIRSDLAHTLVLAGRAEEAERLYVQLYEAEESVAQPDQSRLLRYRNNIAWTWRHQGRLDEAEAEQRLNLALQTELHGEDSTKLAWTVNELATVLSLQGQDTEAEPMFRRALVVREELLGTVHTQVAETLHKLGHLRLRAGDTAEGMILLERALVIRQQ
ncbi:MAG: serine/threonine protein kinase, partial [bacterium]|nr:serine/threonine protein kinase [bacterium]